MIEFAVDSIQYQIFAVAGAIIKSCNDSVVTLLPRNSVAVSGNRISVTYRSYLGVSAFRTKVTRILVQHSLSAILPINIYEFS
jgi:hypothetical protein